MQRCEPKGLGRHGRHHSGLAGGLPADAPPRAGTPEYDKFMQERERKRLMPAAERGDDAKPAAPAQNATQ